MVVEMYEPPNHYSNSPWHHVNPGDSCELLTTFCICTCWFVICHSLQRIGLVLQQTEQMRRALMRLFDMLEIATTSLLLS